jgi:hypothetical protein
MNTLERRIERLEILQPPEQQLQPVMMFVFDGVITASIDGTKYAALPSETEEAFRDRVELVEGQSFFWIAITSLRRNKK